MTGNERYLFDLREFLVVPNALSAAQLAELNGILDRHAAESVGPDANTLRFGGLLAWSRRHMHLRENPVIIEGQRALLFPPNARCAGREKHLSRGGR